jgi:hypothetical protein
MNIRNLFAALVASALAAPLSAFSTDLAAIINKISSNCDKISTFSADAHAHLSTWTGGTYRIGRYDYRKPDSTRLRLIDTIVRRDTTWSTYTRNSYSSCDYAIVPFILVGPIFASATYRPWASADSVIIDRDTLDTVSLMVYSGETITTCWVDMAHGVVARYEVAAPDGWAEGHVYYAQNAGTYFPQRISFVIWDTTIMSGGIEFLNIRLNGGAVTSIAGAPHERGRAAGPRQPTLQVAPEGTRFVLYDLFGRRISSISYMARPDGSPIVPLCRTGRCPSGLFLVRPAAGQNGRAVTSLFSRWGALPSEALAENKPSPLIPGNSRIGDKRDGGWIVG